MREGNRPLGLHVNTETTISQPVINGQLLDTFDLSDGVDTRALRPGDTVAIRTRNSVYTMRLDEPARGRGVAIGSGDFINEESEASLVGATLTGRGSMVKVGWVLLGYKVVLSIPGGELMTSQVQGISINGMPLILAAGTH